MSIPTEYPLCWPPGIGRTERPSTAAFKTALSGARENVYNSLKLFGSDTGKAVSDVILSSNVTGIAGKAPADPGVAVWFMWEGEYRCIAVDRYSKVEWNLQAIHHVIEAERTKMRHGGLNIVRATFRAYMALAAPGKPSWRTVLGVSGKSTPDTVQARWKELAARHHPDKGGDPAKMAEINAARDEALKELGA